LSASERATLLELLDPAEVRRRLAELRARGRPERPSGGGETIEVELRDEDRRSF
jgi:hypothetical protein